MTNKFADYMLFKAIFQLLLLKEHLTNDGLLKILSCPAVLQGKASLNNGLPLTLKEYLPNITPVPRPLVLLKKVPNPQWLSGFVSGEGCFLIDTYNCNTRIGVGVTLRFKIAQHTRDSDLMNQLVQYCPASLQGGCGKFYTKSTQNVGDLVVGKFSDIRDKIIPFFNESPIIGVKYLDFMDFKKAAELIESKSHLSKSGLEQILLIKAGMNRGR